MMQITTVLLKDKEHTLAHPIEIFSEDHRIVNGERMIRVYNDDFKLFGYTTNLESSYICLQEEINLIINSYLYDTDYIHKRPVFKDDIYRMKDKILWHVYGD